MWLNSWLESQRRRLPLRRRPSVEALEDRCLLTLSPAVHYPVGMSPVDTVAGDFNRDGNLDLVTINTSQLSVLHGNGDGTFRAAQTTTAGSSLRAVAAGHFNGDTLLDLATTSSGTRWTGTTYVTENFVNLLLNNGNDSSGNVTFQAARSFSTGTNTTPGALAVGDLNGDGEDDVATAQTGGSNVTVLQGDGSGNLGAARHFEAGSNPVSVAVGDLDGGGRLDLITANQWGNDVSVLLNNGNDSGGNATFQPARHTPVYGTPAAVAVGDFNPGGLLDLAVTSSALTLIGWGYWGPYYQTDGYVNVLLGHGDGAFDSARTTWVNPNELGDVAVEDFNGDGKDDVVTADGIVQPTVDPAVLLGRDDGTFDAPYYFFGDYGPNGLAVGRFNGDSAPDLAAANIYASNVSVFLNDGNWPPLGAPFVSVTGVTVTEGNEGTKEAQFTVTLDHAFAGTVTVDYRTDDGTATAGSDYQAQSGTLTFTEGGPLTQTVRIVVNGDRTPEADYEWFSVTLSNPVNARMGSSQGWGYIQDDEPRISIAGTTITEGNTGTKEAEFTVSLWNTYDRDVTVAYTTADGTAAAGSDYEAKTGSVTIPAGETSATVKVLVYGDRLFEQTEYTYYDWYWGYSYTYFEDSEYLSVNLTSSDHGTIVYGQGVGTIYDDEPRISISGATVTEGHSGTKEATFTVWLATAYDVDVTVAYATADGSASAGSDYQAKSGTVTIKAGQPSATFTVQVNGDRLGEGYAESFSVNLSSPNYGALTYGQGVGTILDDEPQLYISDVYQYEGSSGTTLFTFAVTLSAAYDQDVTFTFATRDGTATAGSDYQAQSGSLTIKAGQTVAYINVVVYGDTTKEESESFSVELSGAPSYVQLYDTSGLGYIYNDDSSPGKRGRKNR